jgi:hypothetical protein
MSSPHIIDRQLDDTASILLWHTPLNVFQGVYKASHRLAQSTLSVSWWGASQWLMADSYCVMSYCAHRAHTRLRLLSSGTVITVINVQCEQDKGRQVYVQQNTQPLAFPASTSRETCPRVGAGEVWAEFWNDRRSFLRKEQRRFCGKISRKVTDKKLFADWCFRCNWLWSMHTVRSTQELLSQLTKVARLAS